MKKIFLILSLSLFFTFSFGQTKEILAQRTKETIKIDGNLSEIAWENAPIATNFVQNAPNPGVAPHYQTEVKVLYDNVALYVAAVLYDPQPDSILREFVQICVNLREFARICGKPFFQYRWWGISNLREFVLSPQR